MAECKKCGSYSIFDNHRCPPKWLALDKENQGDNWEDAVEVYAWDAQDAAIVASEKFDNGSGEGATNRVIHIKDPIDSAISAFRTRFDYSVDYYADEIEVTATA